MQIKQIDKKEQEKYLKKLLKSKWFKTRPEVIKQMILKHPANKYYILKGTGQICNIYSYNEEGTVTVHMSGLRIIDNQVSDIFMISDYNLSVFGVNPEDLKEWDNYIDCFKYEVVSSDDEEFEDLFKSQLISKSSSNYKYEILRKGLCFKRINQTETSPHLPSEY